MDYRSYMPYGYGQMPYYAGMRFPADTGEEDLLERDTEYMKSLFPTQAKTIQALVEEECDKLEYEGSIMFDEYPDRLGLRKIGTDIYNQIVKEEVEEEEKEPDADDIYMMNYGFHYRPPVSHRNQCRGGSCGGGPTRDLIDVLLFNEIFQRRCRHNRCRRRLYW
ncbi:hypothetical protein [Konateibacter massiliensis]|uniref:hypothetical protein n=1 Tax=Konateibacter massiliensis TaxID=2002841 RepID=UPI000C15C93B|nr:hypothetical protein [Konateibacter massiliensis]